MTKCKILTPVFVLIFSVLICSTASAARHTFHWFSIWAPDKDWAVLWESLAQDQESVIIRKNDYSSMLIVSVGGSDGLELKTYTESMSRAFGGTPVKENGSEGYTFVFGHDKLGLNHHVHVWGKKDDVKIFIIHGTDPVLRDIMGSFLYEE